MEDQASFVRIAKEIREAVKHRESLGIGRSMDAHGVLGATGRELLRMQAQQRESSGALMNAYGATESTRHMIEAVAAAKSQASAAGAYRTDMLMEIAQRDARMSSAINDIAQRDVLLGGIAQRDAMVKSLASYTLTPPRELLLRHSALEDIMGAENRALRDATRPFDSHGTAMHGIAKALQAWQDTSNRAAREVAGGEDVRAWLEASAAQERQFRAMRELAVWQLPYQQSIREHLHAQELARTNLGTMHVGQWATALFRASDNALGGLAQRPDQLTSLPTWLRGTSIVAPYLAARATVSIGSSDVDLDEESDDNSALVVAEEQDLVLAAAGASVESRLDVIAAWRPDVAGMLVAARSRVQERGPDFAAQSSISVRRAVETALEHAAPESVVAQWESPRRRMRQDQPKRPTRGSQVRYALRPLDDDTMEAVVIAQVALVDAIMRHANGAIHIGRVEHDAMALLYNLDQIELALSWIAYAQRIACTSS